MDSKTSFGRALKLLRESKNLSQHDFSAVSGRTYLSALERGLKSPTVEKVNELSTILKINPVTLLAQSFLLENPKVTRDELIEIVRKELAEI